ncbi:MAG: hypothetical protein RIA65_06620, partial [Woeseia sp.]
MIAAQTVPVDELDRWTVLSFSKITANEVSVVDGKLQIRVRNSASPLILHFDEPVSLAGISVAASWSGELRIPAGAVQGEEGADDFVLKLGIVEAGDRRLNWFQRSIAADWIKQLFKLAPKSGGVERINFLSTTQQQALLGSERVHPLSDLLYEERVVHLARPGPFLLSKTFAEPVEALGLWVSVDGDDTASEFDLTIESITLQTGPTPLP